MVLQPTANRQDVIRTGGTVGFSTILCRTIPDWMVTDLNGNSTSNVDEGGLTIESPALGDVARIRGHRFSSGVHTNTNATGYVIELWFTGSTEYTSPVTVGYGEGPDHGGDGAVWDLQNDQVHVCHSGSGEVVSEDVPNLHDGGTENRGTFLRVVRKPYVEGGTNGEVRFQAGAGDNRFDVTVEAQNMPNNTAPTLVLAENDAINLKAARQAYIEDVTTGKLPEA